MEFGIGKGILPGLAYLNDAGVVSAGLKELCAVPSKR